ncbi:hypothetical protein SteCoe_6400 [Stentor coeruleus]|uniref:3'-5' exonuclease domain-containing protein n=1 Tax=Stentor coeruleus TaxID=5963 RepID=A0A1R2CQ50_9CILI|nr:hypothetical protein SteCoe_6400 [Stentor coeruleus]
MEYLYVLLVFLGVLGYIIMTKKRKAIEYYEATKEDLVEAWEKIGNLNTPYEIPDIPLSPIDPSNIKYINSKTQLESAIKILSSAQFIGVDIEEYRENTYLGYICLIQISVFSTVYLIDALSLRRNISSLKPIFSNPNITKIFHGCHNDTQWLQRDFGIISVNVFDTQLAGKALNYEKLGLNYFWKKYCGYVMSSEYKKTMQLSRWDLRPLSIEQQKYAAMDAYYLIYLMGIMCKEMSYEQIMSIREETNKICKKEFTKVVNDEKCFKIMKNYVKNQINPQSFHVFSEVYKFLSKIAEEKNVNLEQIVKIEDLVKLSRAENENINDVKRVFSSPLISDYIGKIENIIKTSIEKAKKNFGEEKGEAKSRKEKKQERYNTFLKKFTISGKVFENCQILIPDGTLLCYANHKKVNWYLERDLAEVIREDPYTIKLKFEPNYKMNPRTGEGQRMFYIKEKKNECVVCGRADGFLRYRVVPLLYRQFFTEEYKDMCRHDVLLLCANCHENANKHCDELKKKISKDYEIPLHNFGEIHKAKEKLFSIRKNCISLNKGRKTIPENRQEVLLKNIRNFIDENPSYTEHFKGQDIWEIIIWLCNEDNCKELLKIYGDVNWKVENYDNHGKLVVEKVKDMKEFIIMWKWNFIEKMNPQYMPDSWKELFHIN